MSVKRPIIRPDSRGFTIIELLIATSIFSIIMLVLAVGVLRFTHDYYKGIVSSNTQQTARGIMNEVTQSLQFGDSFSGTDSSSATGSDGYCLGGKLFSFAAGQQVIAGTPNASLHQSRHGLIERVGVSGCSSATPTDDVVATSVLASDQRELLGPRMRVSVFEINLLASSLYTVHIRIISGDDDLLTPTVTPGTSDFSGELCTASVGTQYCSVSDLTTTVAKRL